jgi:NAD(P)-dependent dehydrogenase (short-subunit alcohol dehydrogenase family)
MIYRIMGSTMHFVMFLAFRVDQKGRIDVLFANAGILEFAPLGSITESHIDKSFDINVRVLLFTVQKALPLFQDGGSIILTASVNASKEFEATSIYSATKAAIRSSARCWTVDLKPRKIRVDGRKKQST